MDADEQKVHAFRRQLIAAGLYGERVAVHVGDPLTFPFPPYLANLMVSEDLAKAGIEPAAPFVKKAFASLRPFGGVAWLPIPPVEREAFGRAVAKAELARRKAA